ncbi:MAG: TylF/MycF family methyltransferase [Treponema sp.]|nr:TylF/MycF family methyltransferase [Treponema sp.]
MKRIDHVRHSSLRLITEEIRERNIEGAVAELGVFKGDFAKRLNIAFPDRKLYLFDTFDGFDEQCHYHEIIAMNKPSHTGIFQTLAFVNAPLRFDRWFLYRVKIPEF